VSLSPYFADVVWQKLRHWNVIF